MICHDFSPIVFNNAHVSATVSSAFKHLDDMEASDGVISVSKFTERSLATILGKKHQAPRVTTIHNGVPNLSRRRTSRSEDLSLKDYLVYVGNREPRKNLITAVDSIRALRKKSKISFVIVGSASWGDLVKFEENFNFVIQLENCDEGEKNEIIANSKGLIYPSLFEGFGLPILEAYNLGVNVVASDSSSIGEVIFSKDYLFDPTNEYDLLTKIELLLNPDNMPSTTSLKAHCERHIVGI